MTATITLMPMIWMPRSIIGGYADSGLQREEFRSQNSGIGAAQGVWRQPVIKKYESLKNHHRVAEKKCF